MIQVIYHVRPLCLVIFFLFSSNSYAISPEDRTWVGLFFKKPSKSFDIWGETQLRYNLETSHTQQVLNRFGLLKSINTNHELGILFAHVTSQSVTSTSTVEHRPTLQHSYFSSIGLSIRNRIEWRALEQSSSQSIRLRTMIRYSHPLKSHYSLLIWDEPFLNLHSVQTWSGNQLIERNRLFLGFRKTESSGAFEFGYLNQWTPRANQNVSEHILVFYSFF